MNRVLVFVSVLMVGLPALAGAAGDAATLSKEHYDAYCRYNFVGDEATLKKYKSVDRAHKAFARAERMKSKALTELIARGDTVGSCEAFKGVWEQRLRKSSQRSPGWATSSNCSTSRSSLAHRLVRGERQTARMSWSGRLK